MKSTCAQRCYKSSTQEVRDLDTPTEHTSSCKKNCHWQSLRTATTLHETRRTQHRFNKSTQNGDTIIRQSFWQDKQGDDPTKKTHAKTSTSSPAFLSILQIPPQHAQAYPQSIQLHTKRKERGEQRTPSVASEFRRKMWVLVAPGDNRSSRASTKSQRPRHPLV